MKSVFLKWLPIISLHGCGFADPLPGFLSSLNHKGIWEMFFNRMEVVHCKNFIHRDIKRTLPPSISWDRFLRGRGGKMIPQFIYDSRNSRRKSPKYHRIEDFTYFEPMYLDIDSSQKSVHTDFSKYIGIRFCL